MKQTLVRVARLGKEHPEPHVHMHPRNHCDRWGTAMDLLPLHLPGDLARMLYI